MFLDLFEFKAVEVDGEPATGDYRIRFHSSGKVEVYEDGSWHEPTKEEVRQGLDLIGKFYGV